MTTGLLGKTNSLKKRSADKSDALITGTSKWCPTFEGMLHQKRRERGKKKYLLVPNHSKEFGRRDGVGEPQDGPVDCGGPRTQGDCAWVSGRLSASQLFWFFLTFIALYFLLSKVFLPRVGETIEERGSRIADDLDQASRMQREAEEAEKAYTSALADARAKAMNVAETTKKAVDTEIQAELAAADAEADKAAEAAENRIRQVRTDALANIESVAADSDLLSFYSDQLHRQQVMSGQAVLETVNAT